MGGPRSAGRPARRAAGVLLLELVISLGVLVLGILSLLSALRASALAASGMDELDKVRIALENAAELLRRTRFNEIYWKYDAAMLPASELEGPGGEPATIRIECHVNELTIPPEFGPVRDLDGKGGLETADCSASYLILPVHLTLTYENARGPITKELYLLLEPGN